MLAGSAVAWPTDAEPTVAEPGSPLGAIVRDELSLFLQPPSTAENITIQMICIISNLNDSVATPISEPSRHCRCVCSLMSQAPTRCAGLACPRGDAPGPAAHCAIQSRT